MLEDIERRKQNKDKYIELKQQNDIAKDKNELTFKPSVTPKVNANQTVKTRSIRQFLKDQEAFIESQKYKIVIRLFAYLYL
jgi:hypothetical protein